MFIVCGIFSRVLTLTRRPLPSSAFFVFCSDHRPRIKEENPGISIGEIAKKLGELWAAQSPKDKAPYAAKASKLKEKYEKVSFCSAKHYKICLLGSVFKKEKPNNVTDDWRKNTQNFYSAAPAKIYDHVTMQLTAKCLF